jgi:Hydrazine synthase alpha subunit middle domain
MKNTVRALTAAVAMSMTISVSGFARESAQDSMDADVIVTAAPAYAPLDGLEGGERFAKGAQLLLIHTGAGNAEPLVPGFAATADANVSFDGERVLFAGKQTANDPWQIWEITLKNRSVRRIIAGEGDAIRPFYLPAGRLIYARRTAHGFQIEAAGKDADSALAPIDEQAGANVTPLSYLPGSAIPADVLRDGRILFEAGFPLGAGMTPELYLVYSDGSGVESYRCDHGRARWGGKQLASGDVVFTHGNSLARFTSPLAHEAPIAAPHAEYAGAIEETPEGTWLMSARSAAGAHYSLRGWRPGSSVLKTVLAVAGKDLVEPVVVAPRARPKRHPSGLHPWDYANMMALDARLSREGDLKTAPVQVRLETMDTDGHVAVTGTAPVEPDGSFLVRTPADKPIRFELLDRNGAVIRKEHGWFWIRAGEQRYCVGCHTGPERSPENRVPAVLLRTTVPADLTGAKPVNEAQSAPPRGN